MPKILLVLGFVGFAGFVGACGGDGVNPFQTALNNGETVVGIFCYPTPTYATAYACVANKSKMEADAEANEVLADTCTGVTAYVTSAAQCPF